MAYTVHPAVVTTGSTFLGQGCIFVVEWVCIAAQFEMKFLILTDCTKDHSYITKSTKSLFFFHLPLHSACCVLLLYFTVVVACCLYSETACLTFEFYLLFMGGGPYQLCVYENLDGIPNVRCSCDMISIQWLSQCFDKTKHSLSGTEKGLGLSVARILTLYTTFEVRMK